MVGVETDGSVVDVEAIRFCAARVFLGVCEQRAAVEKDLLAAAVRAVVDDLRRAPFEVIVEARLEQEDVTATRALVRLSFR